MILKDAGRSKHYKSMLAGTPHGKLLLSILIQALLDATKTPNKQDRKQMVRECAVQFLITDSDMLTLCTWIADLDIEEMRETLQQNNFSQEAYLLIFNYLLGKRPEKNIPEEDDDEDDMDL